MSLREAGLQKGHPSVHHQVPSRDRGPVAPSTVQTPPRRKPPGILKHQPLPKPFPSAPSGDNQASCTIHGGERLWSLWLFHSQARSPYPHRARHGFPSTFYDQCPTGYGSGVGTLQHKPLQSQVSWLCSNNLSEQTTSPRVSRQGMQIPRISGVRGTRDPYQWGSPVQDLALGWQMMVHHVWTLSVTPPSTELLLWKDLGTASFFFPLSFFF